MGLYFDSVSALHRLCATKTLASIIRFSFNASNNERIVFDLHSTSVSRLARCRMVSDLGRVRLPLYNHAVMITKFALKKNLLLILVLSAQLFLTTSVFAQAFGEYGRVVGGLPQGVGPSAPGSAPQGGSGSGGIGGFGGKALPTRLIVAAKETGLYPKQDDESEKLAQLQQGEALVPMLQTSGGNDWYMVKTQKGVIGWVKSGDVKEEKAKK